MLRLVQLVPRSLIITNMHAVFGNDGNIMLKYFQIINQNQDQLYLLELCLIDIFKRDPVISWDKLQVYLDLLPVIISHLQVYLNLLPVISLKFKFKLILSHINLFWLQVNLNLLPIMWSILQVDLKLLPVI